MALPADFSKIFGSTATGGLTPIGDVNYAKGWEFVGANPPTKNDFSYLQNLSDLKSQWLYSNKLQRTDPFGDIKSDGTVTTALENLGLSDSAGFVGRLIGKPKIFTSSGTYTPTPGTKSILVEVLGGGGGGGGAQAGTGFASFGAGGAAGSYAKGWFTNSQASYLVTVGAGGNGGGGTENGSPGGTTSLGSLISASGGNPGQTASSDTTPYIMGSLGAPGSVTGGNVISNPSQNTGGFGFRLSASVCSGGIGSDSIYGRGGDAASSTNRAGRDATGYGAGGGGGRATNQSGVPYIGGDGSDGIVIIWEFA